MGRYLKIELLAIIMILVMLGVSYLIKVENDKANKNASAKELEIFDSVTVEVNSSAVKSRLYSDYAVQKSGSMEMIWLTYSGKTAKELKSKFGRSVGDKFYLDINVTMLQENGYYYEADHAIYDKKSDIFYATSPFVAYVHSGNIIHGINLKYNIKEKITTAENVDAVFYTDD
ncbi:MAG: hypothetical protein U9R26_04510 [Campylobacterota bacterium]|nr:hypothetical protein [Campylobacterota bacterium]